MEVKDRFDEVFQIVIDGWCYGISNYPGEIFPALVHNVIKDLGVDIRTAIECNVIFDVLDVSARLSRAAKYLVDERDIAFSILSQFPHPADLPEDGQFVVAQLVDQVEQAYGDAIDYIE